MRQARPAGCWQRRRLPTSRPPRSGEGPSRVGRLRFPLPTFPVALTQLVLSAADWALAGAVLYVLLPTGAVPFLAFLGAFLTAILLGMASHVPGGLGVFEGLLIVLLKPYLSSGDLLPPLLVYRAVYYLLPFMVALVGLTIDELRQRRAQAARVTAAFGRLTEQITPRLLGALTFLSGAVLLFSGATPAAPGRLERLAPWLPLGVIEVSHFTGSVVGVVLLLLSQGLSRRLDAAYYLTSGAIGVGILASLLKGLDYEEAIFLTFVLLGLVRARPAFDRRAAFFETRFSARLGRDCSRRTRSVDLARALRLQARRLFAAALVAVRAAAARRRDSCARRLAPPSSSCCLAWRD